MIDITLTIIYRMVSLRNIYVDNYTEEEYNDIMDEIRNAKMDITKFTES